MNQEQLVAYVDKFKRDYRLLSQQMRPRLNPYYEWEPDALDARYFYFNYIGKVDPRIKQTFGGPTPRMSPAHSRRQGSTVTYEWGDGFDDDQLSKMIANPTARHKQVALAGFYRKMDVIGITAALGNAVQANADGTTTNIALPAGQLVAHGGTGMTIGKLRTARELFNAAELVDVRPEPLPEALLVSAKQITNLLATTEVTSADYNTVKALVDGKIDTFMGFKFVRTEQLPVDGSARRRCIALAAGAIGAYMEPEPKTEMGVDPGNSFINNVYMTQKLGAARLEEARVVEIPCVE